MPDPWILVDPGLLTPPDRDYWTTPEMYDPETRHPSFALHEVAKCFFGRSPGWLRAHLRGGGSVVDGENIQPMRVEATNYRVFRLYDIERVAHALAHNRKISGAHLSLVIMMVKTNARLNQLIS